MIGPTHLAVILALLAALFTTGCGQNQFQQEVETETTAVKLTRETVTGDYPLITTEELKSLLDKQADVLIVDAMPREESYNKAHVPGAKQFLFPIQHMPEWQTGQTGGKSEQDYVALLGEDKDKLIVVYCGFVKCARSHNAAVWAKRLGYTNVQRHPGGIYAWKGAGYPTESAE